MSTRIEEDREALARDARTLRDVRYDCDCQVGGVDATSIDADYLHAVSRRIGRVLAARQPAPVDVETVQIIASESGRPESVVRDWLLVAGIEVKGRG